MSPPKAQRLKSFFFLVMPLAPLWDKFPGSRFVRNL